MRIVVFGTAGKTAPGVIPDLSDHGGLLAAIRFPETGHAWSVGHDVGGPSHYFDNMETGRKIVKPAAGSDYRIKSGRGHD